MRRQGWPFRGWVVVATSALGLLFGAFPIVVSSFPFFFQAYLREFHESRANLALSLTIHNVFAALLATWTGRLADRLGARTVILTGLGLLGLVLLSAKTIGASIWHLYAFYATLGLVSDATTSVPYGLLVSRWFNRRRGLALGLTMTGLGLGAIIMPLVVRQLIGGYGWRSAFAIVGLAVLIVPMPVVGWFLSEPPHAMRISPDGEVARSEGLAWPEIRGAPSYWLMVAAFVLAAASISACMAHMAQLFADRGASSAAAAIAVSTGGLALLAGRAGGGFFLDRFFGPHVAMCFFLLSGAGMAFLLMGATGVSALFGAFLVGLGLGAEVDLMAYLLGRYFGLRSLGTAFGFAFGAFVLAAGFGPLLMGAAFDRTGSYRMPLAACLIATLLATAQMGVLGPYRFAAMREQRAPDTEPELEARRPTAEGI
jgi:MFS family permease